MKTTSRAFLFVLTFLALAAGAYAQNPRAELKQMVEQLQKAPGDNALREKIITLAATLKPAPAVPEDARRAFIRGNTAFAAAKDPAGFSRAIERFEEASALAPWWADPYFNLAKACEGTQDFDCALRALKYYRATAKTEADKRQGQDLSYALEEKRDLKKADAAAEKAKEEKAKAAADTPQAREAALFQKLEGARFVVHHTPENSGLKPGTMGWDEIFEIKGRALQITAKVHYINSGSVYGHRQPGEYLIDSISYREGGFTQSYNGFTTIYRIKADGQALIKQYESGGGLEIPRN
jgi:tetratricopeptide (TPR) repeat protein